MISRATTRAELLHLLEAQLQERTRARAMQLMWQADSTPQPLFGHQPMLRLPTAAERVELDAGSSVEAGALIYLPLIVLGKLRGWLALQAARPSDSLPELIAPVGLALALLEDRPPPLPVSQELAAMDTIGQLLSSTLQLDEVLSHVAAVTRELVVAHHLYIALVDETGQSLEFAHWSSKPEQDMPQLRWSINEGLTGLIVRTRQPILTHDYQAEVERLQVQRRQRLDLGSQAWLGVPLVHHERVLGVMVAISNNPAIRYDERDLHLLSSVAAQAAAAIANAQLYRRVEQQANQLALINRIGRTISATLDPQEVPMLIMRELKAALDVEDGALLLEEHGSDQLVVRYMLEPTTWLRLPTNVGLVGEALRLREVRIANNMQDAPETHSPYDRDGLSPTHSLICAPLAGRQRLRGVILLRNKRSGGFAAADAALLASIAEQAAVALEHAELYAHADSALTAHLADLEQRNQQLTNIVAISNALRSANDVYSVGRQIVATIQVMTDSPRIALGLVDPERQQVRTVAQVGFARAATAPRHEYWTTLAAAERTLQETPQISTLTYHLGQHPLSIGFSDCIMIALRDPGGTLVGVIGFDDVAQTKPLSSELIQELEIIANQASIAIVNARLASEQEQTVNRLTALNALNLAVTTNQLSTDEVMQMTISGAIGTTGGVGGGAWVRGRDDLPRRLVLDLPPGCDEELLPLLNSVSEDYIELVTPDLPLALVAADVRSVLIVPVRGAKMTLGGLWIGYNYTLIAPTEREMAVLYAKTAGAVLENVRLLDQVRAAHDRLASILASTAEGMLMADAQGRIAAVNAAFTHFLGLPTDALEGRPLDDLLADEALAADREQIAPLWEALRLVACGAHDDLSGEAYITSPSQRNLAWSVLPVRGQSGPQGAALLVMRDVTAERQMEKMREDLANMIVHDLRAPLTNMMVSVDLLNKQISGPLTEGQQRIVRIAGTSSQQMLDLVNALLDIRRLEQRQLELQQQPAELFEIVESVLERLERVADDRAVRLVNQTAPLPPIRVDIDLVRRIVQNLVDNATKFTPRGGQVQISAYPDDGTRTPRRTTDGRWAVVEVLDNGPGVPESYRGVIFEMFGQAPHGRGQGTGLGLAFCKLAVAAHGGTIWVDDAPNGGAVFRFTLPLA